MEKTNVIHLSDSFPELREFSHSKTNSAKAFIPRFEDKTWTSILYIERGNFQIRYETGEILRPKGGTFYYHPPLSLKYQTSDKLISPYSMYHLAVDLSVSNAMILSSDIFRQQIIEQLPKTPFIRQAPPLLVSAFKNVFREYSGKQPGYLAQIENSLRQILISAVRSNIWKEEKLTGSRSFRNKVDLFLLENKDFMGPVGLLFERLGVRRSRGYEIFHDTFGINPKEYLLRKKIIFAKEMLLEESDITSIAYNLGFSSSQSFATVFKKLTCSTPTEFRKKYSKK